MLLFLGLKTGTASITINFENPAVFACRKINGNFKTLQSFKPRKGVL